MLLREGDYFLRKEIEGVNQILRLNVRAFGKSLRGEFQEVSRGDERAGRDERHAHVVVETRIDCLFLSTFHTFPEENTIIKSQTLIEKQKS